MSDKVKGETDTRWRFSVPYLVITYSRRNFRLGQSPREGFCDSLSDEFCEFFYFRETASRSVKSPLIEEQRGKTK